MRLLTILTLLFTSFIYGQLSDKHWLPPLHSRSATNVGEHVVYLSTPVITPFQVNVTNGNGLALGTYTISSGNPVQFTVGNNQPSDMFVTQAGLHTVSGDDGLILTGTEEFYVTFKVRSSAHGEVFVSKGRAGLGTDFRLGSSPQFNTLTDGNRNFVSSVMATENNTVVNFSDYDAGVTFTTPTGTNSNATQTFTLQAGQSVVVSGYANITPNLNGFIGARLTSTKPVAVTTGNMTSNPDTGGNDICLDQIVPVERVGMEYVVIKGNGISTTELPIVIATENNTQIFVNGIAAPIATINAGDYFIVPFSYYQGAFNQNMYIETDKPVYLYQVLAGDTATFTTGLNFIPPLSCSFPKVVDLIPSINAIGTSTSFTSNIILLTVAGSVITINGTPTTAPPQAVLGNPSWVTYRIPGYTGNVKVESTGSTAVGVFGESGTIGYASFYSGFGSVNITYEVGVGIEESDMTIANGLAPCPGDIRVLETGLDPADFTFEWSVDIGDGNGPVVIAGETGPSYSVDSPGIYCVTTSNGFVGSACEQIDCVVVEYQQGFVINNNPDDLYSCDNDFDLSDNSPTILNGLDPFTYDVLFYATLQDAIDNTNQISALQTTTATVTTFYVRVESFAFACFQITQFDAVVSACQINTPPDMIVCDDITNNGTETFDLTSQNAAVLGALSASDFTITYHLDQAGADTDNTTNLATPANAFIGGPNQIIYVRMESNADPTQYSTTTFTLIVNPLPTAAIGTSTICSGQTATVTFSGTPNATVQYLDNLGATQSVLLNGAGSATVTTPVLTSNATYSLIDVTSTANCVRSVNGTATVTVLSLPTATISANTICSGTTGTITITGTPNATVQYTVDSGVNQTAVLNGAGTVTIISPILTANSTYCLVNVTSNTTPACSQSVTDCATITVIPLPTASISANTTCNGSTGTVTITGTPNATVQYTVDSGANLSIVLNASGTATITSSVLTMNSVYCLVDITSSTTPTCSQSVTSCATITVLPLPTASISANTVCSGETGTVTITGTPNSTVQYTVDSGVNQSVVLNASGTATITSPVLTMNSVYCLVDVTSATTPACTQAVTSCATITINPLPTVSISTTTPSICSGTSATISFTGTSNATITYTIDGSSNTIVLDGSGNASVTATTTSTYCLVSAASSSTPVCNQSFTDCVTITVIPLPTVAISGDTVCAGDSATVTFTGTPGSTVNYNLGATAQTPVVLSATGTATVTTTSPAGTYTYTVVDVTSATTPPCTATIIGQVATVTVLNAPVIGPISDIHVCDDDNNGTTFFNLTPAVNQAQTGNPGSTVTVHPTLADAQFNANALTAAEILSYSSITQTLHIRVENAGGCFSLTTVNLIVDARPELNQSVAAYELCDVNAPGDGIEVFDLTNATLTNDITNGVTGLTLTYYTSLADAQVPQNAIVNPSTYSNTSTPQTIWVVGENAQGCRHITTVELIVNPLPPITPLAPMNGCSDGINPDSAPFNLTLNDALVTSGAPGFVVTYHFNQADADLGSSPLASPYNSISNPQVVYVRVENNDTGCYDTTTLQLNVTQGPTANQPADLTYCDPDNDGYGEFDLQSTLTQISAGPTPTGVTVTFHETQADAMQVPPANPIVAMPYLNNVQDVQTIYVAVSYTLTGCTNYTSFNLIVNPTPELNLTPSALEECDDAVADGITQFDLTQANTDILNTIDPTTVQISYHLTQANAQSGTPQITNILNYTNSSSPNFQTIYVRVEVIATGCFKVVPLDLIVNPRPIMPTPESIVLTLCDDNNAGDQQELFDLTGHIPNIVGTQTNMIVTFHFTQADALSGVSPLPSPYQNTSNTQSIFVRVENGQTGCFDVVILDLRVEPLPILLMPNAAATTLCDDDAVGDGFNTFDLTSLVNGMLNGAPNVTISFYETTPDATANPPIPPIANPSAYMNIDPYMQMIYVLAENTLTGCRNVYPLTLTVHAAPVMPTPPLPDLTECDNNYDGFRVFDLTVQNAAILAANPSIPATPLPIRYYQTLTDAMNGTAAIVTPSAYTNQSNPQTIWVVITDPVTGCSAMESFDLIVNVPVNVAGQNNELTLCDDGATNDQVTTFDLTVLNPQIVGTSPVSAGATVVYYTSLANAQTATNPIATPTAFVNTVNPQNLWAVVTTTDGCKSIALAKVRVVPSPTPFMFPTALEVCDDDQTIIGSELFDVTQNQTQIQNGFAGLVFEYYPTQADAEAGTNIILNPLAYQGGDATATPPTNIVYIKVKNAYTDFYGNNCYKIVEQELIVNPLPVIVDTTYVICDDDTDGFASFDLSFYNAQLLDSSNTGQATTDFTVTYYDTQINAQSGTSVGLLPNTYTNTANPQMIYPRVVNNTTGCVNALAEVSLMVKLKAIANPISQAIIETFTKCDYYGANDGVEQFDLTAVESDLLGTQTSPPITITYHLTPMDQATGANPIANITAFENTSNPQTIYIRVERANDDPLDMTDECYDVAEITLNVELLAEPVITSPSETICVDFNTGDLISGITLDSGIAQGSGYAYQWSLNGTAITGAVDATYTITTVSPGDYTVVVTSTSAQGCVSNPSAPFTVIQSGPPANIQTYVTGAFEEIQTITVVNDGYGDYEYQLEPGAPWQSSPVFTNIPAGVVYTIQIRDVKTLNPCGGGQTSAVQVINYPHFFTPNGDGINDTWNIRGLNDQTNAKIYIFDRYGKLLKQISSKENGGWNGTFNGQPLPSTDYWFTVDYYEITPTGALVPKQFKAHFSLKR